MERYPDLNKLRILHYPDPRLRGKAGQIKQVDSFLQEMNARMSELMEQAHGVGLAATQLGLPIRFIVINPEGEEGKPQAFINPVILERTGRVVEEEGCLSVPGIHARVRRALHVSVRAQLLTGETVEIEAEGLAARVWQHELDHLDGSLFVDRLGVTKKILIASRLHDLEKAFEDEAPKIHPEETKSAAKRRQ